MLKRLLKRWQVVPTWAKATPVALLLVALLVLHAKAPVEGELLASGVHRLFFVPLFLFSLLYGLRGGLICAFVVSLGNVPWIFGPQPMGLAAWLNLGMEVGLYFITGAITGFFVDRERREVERLKRAESLALLGQAAAAVAHELKTPLVAIGGFAQRIQRDLPPEHPHADKLRIIVDQVAHMEQLLREMLDYSRPLKLHLYPQPLNELVLDVVSLCYPLAAECGVRIETDLDPELGSPVMDGARVRQVVLNLVQNAVQASPRGDQVLVRTCLHGNSAGLEVRDQGPGIPREHRDKVFYPFFTTKSHGTGLGLAICSKIVQAHAGSLRLLDLDRKGSTFSMRLPLNGPGRDAAGQEE